VRPTVAQLEAVYWVYKLGSVKEASRHLNITQPTTSLRIQEMEGHLGQQLFDRIGRKMSLSRFGESVLPWAKAVLDGVATINGLVSDPTEISGVLRLGCAEAFAMVCLPECVQRLQLLHPALNVDIQIDTSANLEVAVRERTIDMAFLINPIGDSNLALLQLGLQEVAWYTSSRDDIREPVAPHDLVDRQIVITSVQSPMYRQTLEWFREAGTEPRKLTFCSSLFLIKHFVSSAGYVSLLPKKMMQFGGAASQPFRELQSTGAKPVSRLYSIYRFSDVGPAINALNDVAREVIRLRSYG